MVSSVRSELVRHCLLWPVLTWDIYLIKITATSLNISPVRLTAELALFGNINPWSSGEVSLGSLTVLLLYYFASSLSLS